MLQTKHDKRKQRTFDSAANFLSQIASRVKRRCCERYALNNATITRSNN